MWIWGFQPALGFPVCGFEVSSMALGVLACIQCFWCAFGVSSLSLGSPVWMWGFPAWLWGSQSGSELFSMLSPTVALAVTGGAGQVLRAGTEGAAAALAALPDLVSAGQLRTWDPCLPGPFLGSAWQHLGRSVWGAGGNGSWC